MRGQLILFIFVNCLLFDVFQVSTSGYKFVDHDLEVAGSDKHEKAWDEGDEEDFHDEKKAKKGKDEKKGYEGDHE